MQQPLPPRGRVRLTEVNPHLVCVLCHGYFIDATTMAECPHSFCRSCIVLYLETKSYCPICEVQIHKTKPHLNLKPDKTLQDMVYKLVPGLFHDEMRRRREFYAKYANRDLYLGPEARGVGVERIIYSPEDHVSLSLEYYDERYEVDADTHNLLPNEPDSNSSDREREEWASARPGTAPETITQQQKPPGAADGMKRYLQCPAVLTMSHLKKFIRLKYGLSQACTVEILYRRESLPDSYSLMDIAYIYTWKRNGPMRFYYRIHVPTPLKTILPALKPSSEPIRDSVPLSEQKLKSPELLDAVGLRPKPPEPLPLPKPIFDFQEDEKKEEKAVVEAKKEEEKKISPEEDTAVSQLLALSNGQGPKREETTSPEQEIVENKQTTPSLEPPPVSPMSVEGSRQPTGNGNVFKVPQSLTKRFVFNGGKLVAVKSKQPSGKPPKAGDKTKLNGKMNGEISPLVGDRYSNPLGLVAAGPLGNQGGRLPPGSPRPPPNAEKFMKTKYTPPSGLLLNRLAPEITLSQNKPTESSPKPHQQPSSQPKANTSSQKSNGLKTSSQPPHRKEVNRLEQIVQNCLKKEISQKSLSGGKRDADEVKRSGTLPASAGNGEAARAATSIPQNHVAAGKPDQVNITENKDTERSILKRKLNDPPYNKRPTGFAPPVTEGQNGVGDPKKRRAVHPDVSIQLMANPAKEKQHKERKREPSDLSTLTKRFLHDIQKMKMIDSEIKINKVDQMCASTVKIEKVPAPPSQAVATPASSPGGGKKSIEGTEFNSEDDQLFIDIRNKCEALKRKHPEPASVAIERVSEDQAVKPASPPTKGSEAPGAAVASGPDTSPKPSGTHKKLPRLIEINAPPRPKLSTTPGAESKQKTGIKMTTVRKEVPIGKEGPLVRRDCNGALDLSSGLSPPGTPKSRSKSPFQRPASTERSPTPSSLSPLLAMSSFSHPESNRSPPIRIPSLKPKTSPTPRPSSLSSSSPSPPAEPRTAAEVFPSSAYHQLLRHQMELQSRFLASQVNNNTWTREQPLTAKKFEEWMRNVMNLPHHPLMFPNQLSPDAAARK